MAKIHAYLNFNGNCASAFEFYAQVFEIKSMGTYFYGDIPMGETPIPESAKGKIMHTALALNEDQMIMGSDVIPDFGHTYQEGNNAYIMIDTETADDATKIYTKLSQNAKKIEAELGEQPWAELYACFTDQFGINWMIHFEGNKTQVEM